MNKLTKLMLASAMMITSGFATVKEFDTGNINQGNFEVRGEMKLNAVGVYHFINAGTMTFTEGSLVTSENDGKIGNIYNLKKVEGEDLEKITNALNETLGTADDRIVYEVKHRGKVVNNTGADLGVQVDDFSLASTVTWGWKEIGDSTNVVYNLVTTAAPSINNAVAICGRSSDMEIFKEKNHKFVSLPGDGEVAAGVLLENKETDLECLKYLSGPVYMNLPSEHNMVFKTSEDITLKNTFKASMDGNHDKSIIFDAGGKNMCFEGKLDLQAVNASFKNGHFIFEGEIVI